MVRKKLTVKNISLIIVVLMLMALIVFMVGKAFGFFNYAKEGSVVNTVTIKGLSINVNNETDEALNITNAYPVYDSEGMENDPFIFTITNNSSHDIEYNLKIENDSEKLAECVQTNGTCPELSTNYIKYSYKLNNGSWSSPSSLGNNENIVFSDAVLGNESVTVSIKLWIDSAAGNEIQGTYFFGKLVLEGTKTNGNTVKVNFDDNIDLLYGLLDNQALTTAGQMQYTISNKIFEVTALSDDGFGVTPGKVDLEAGKTYIFNCMSDASWRTNPTSENGYTNTVEAFLMLNGAYTTYYHMDSGNNFEFTPSTTGEYWLRLDVNKNGETHYFWNISVKEKNNSGVKHVTVGETYGNLPTPTREGYTFKGWHGKNEYNNSVYNSYRYSLGLPNTTGDVTILSSNSSSVYFKINGGNFDGVLTDTIYLEPNTNYVVSFNRDDIVDNGTNTYAYRDYIYSIDSSGNYGFLISSSSSSGISNDNNKTGDVSLAFTTTETGKMALAWSKGDQAANSEVKIENIKIEKGTTKTAYEPYYITSNTTVVQNQNHTLTAIWEKNN